MDYKYTLQEIETNCPEYTNFGEDARKLTWDMLSKCKKDKGLGLSANQIGLTDRVFVVVLDHHEYGAFNPVFAPIGDEQVLMKEGCLSYPGLWLNIKRPAKVRARYQTYDGEWIERNLEGIEARVFQHETDHLNGVPFIARVSKLKLDRALAARSKHVNRMIRNMGLRKHKSI